MINRLIGGNEQSGDVSNQDIDIHSNSTIRLRYGCNPNQKADCVVPVESGFRVLNGTPSWINIMDALQSWQLVRDLSNILRKPAATSYKHLSPAGVAVTGNLDSRFLHAQEHKEGNYSKIANAYIRARGGDRMSSFGDAVAVSEVVDVSLATVLKREYSDLIIAPGYDDDALEILKRKKKGNYLVFQIDKDYVSSKPMQRSVFGFSLTQDADSEDLMKHAVEKLYEKVRSLNNRMPLETIAVAMFAAKYAQSNTIAIAYDGQAIGIGAGQQSRIHCTRIACQKAEKWMLQLHPKSLNIDFLDSIKRTDKPGLMDQFILSQRLSEFERQNLVNSAKGDLDFITSSEAMSWFKKFKNVCMVSDGFIPFRDNVDRAAMTHVDMVIHPGGAGSVREEQVRQAANFHGISLLETSIRLFQH